MAEFFTASPPLLAMRLRSCLRGQRCVSFYHATSCQSTYGDFCQLRVWDLWQISHSHVDVYFPYRTAEVELGLLPSHLSPTTSHHIDKGMPSFTHADPIKHASSPIVNEGQRWDVASPSNATFHSQYHPLDEIHSFVRDLSAAYPHQVSIISLGHSGEGREMFALEITSRASAGHKSHDQNSQVVFNKKGKQSDAQPRCGFLITGAQHAREVRFSRIIFSFS
jgi:Zinc carboxypeptidase